MTVKRRLAALAIALCSTLMPVSARSAQHTISMNVRNANLQDVIALIAAQAGINIVLDASAGQNVPVTMRLDHVDLRTALQSLETAYGLAEAWQGNVLHVGAADTIVRAFPTTASSVREQVFTIVNSDPIVVAHAVQSVLPVGTIIVPDVRSSTVVVKGPADAITAASQLIASLDRARSEGPSYATVAVELSNVRASDAATTIRTQIPGSNANEQISASDHPNELLVTGSPDFVAAVRASAAQLDRPGRQVRFSVRVLDVTPINNQTNVGFIFGGIEASNGQNGNGASSISQNLWALTTRKVPIGVIVNTLITQGKGRVLAEPTISSLNNEKAVLNVGEQYPLVYFNPQSGTNNVQFVNIGVNMTITPTIGGDGDVTCALDTDYSEIVSFSGVYPIIGQRHVNTTMRVGNDQTIILGGLFKDVDETTITKFPFLGDIPVLGEFFKNRQNQHSRDEVVFLITPHIVNGADFHAAPPTELQKTGVQP